MPSPELRTNVLLFGPSRSGKTYLTSQFVELGANAYDAEAEGLCRWTNDNTGEVAEYPAVPSEDWLQVNHFRISVDGLTGFIRARQPLLMLGHAWNILDCLSRFDQSYFLHVPPAELERRLAINRNPGTEMIARPAVLDFHRQIHARRLKQAREQNIPILDATLPAAHILDLILRDQRPLAT